MKKVITATVKGGLNTSIQILLDTAHQVGDILDLRNITRLVPDGINLTAFFNSYANFCSLNGDSQRFIIQAIRDTGNGCEVTVKPCLS